MTIGILTISDTRTEETDTAGPAIANELQALAPTQIVRRIVPDEYREISDAIVDLSNQCQVLFTTGGTGFSPRDVTPEATLPLLTKRANGIETLLMLRGMEKTEFAPMSRGVCGLRGSCLVINLPGSPSGAVDGIRALMPLLPHLLDQIAGGGHCSKTTSC